MNPFPLHVFTDFDGTITREDTLDFILNRYAGPDWVRIEEQVERGELREIDALQMEFNLVRAPLRKAFFEVEEEIGIDPAFGPFARWCQDSGIGLEILSGGFASLIQRVLNRHALPPLVVHANEVKQVNGRWVILPSPMPRITGACNHCKTRHLKEKQQLARTVAYIGDGTTDRCPAAQADWVYAKGKLAQYCQARHIPYFPFETFGQIHRHLEQRVAEAFPQEKEEL